MSTPQSCTEVVDAATAVIFIALILGLVGIMLEMLLKPPKKRK